MDIKVGVSNHHVHLTAYAVDILFGKDYQLTKKRDLVQLGQFACEETVDIKCNGKVLEHIRVIGPVRNYTQVELLSSDNEYFQINAPIRNSGDLRNSETVDIIGPKGILHAVESTIVSNTHIHMSKEDLEIFNVKPSDKVSVLCENGVIINDVNIKSDETCKLELHINKDVAQNMKIETGMKVNIC